MKSDSNFFLVLITCIFFGIFGAHRFMVGKIGTGILMILSNFIGLGWAWWIVDLIFICSGNFRDIYGDKVLPDT